MMAPGATVSLHSQYGARLLAWADGMPDSLNGEDADLYGFLPLRSGTKGSPSPRPC